MAGNVVTVVVRARDATGAGLRGVRNAFTGFQRGLLNSMARGFRGGIGDSIAQGLNAAAKNPYVAAAVLALIASLTSLIGAALGGALVLALGGAFVGLGGVIAAQSKRVKKAWKNELEELKPLFRDAAKPMIPVLEDAIDMLGRMGRKFAPHFKSALEDAQPHLTRFLDHFEKGMGKLGGKAFEPLMKAFNELLDEFGPQFSEWLGSLGDSLKGLADAVIENKEAVALALRIMLELLPLAIDFVAALVREWGRIVFITKAAAEGFRMIWDSMQIQAAESLKAVIGVVQHLTNAFFEFFDSMLAGAEKAFGWIPGIGDKLSAARESFGAFRDDVNAKYESVKRGADEFIVSVKEAAKERHLKMNISAWKKKLADAKDELRSVPKSKTSKVKARIDQLKDKIREARARLNGIDGYTATTYIRSVYYTANDPRTLAAAHGRAHGGVIGAAATGGVRNNMTLVGEQGPEVVDLPAGSRVRSNPDTRRLLSGAGAGGGGGLNIEFRSSGRRADDLLIEMLREAIKTRGGDPVKVLRSGA